MNYVFSIFFKQHTILLIFIGIYLFQIVLYVQILLRHLLNKLTFAMLKFLLLYLFV